MEADPRHAELVIKQLEVGEMRPVTTPGFEGKDENDQESEQPLKKARATEYHGVAARLNYLSADRPDIQFSIKEACRDMATPTAGSCRRLERIARYLVGSPRLVWRFDLQGPINTLEASSDANWAGCRASRESTSGGVLMIGSHPIKSYAKTQATTAKSSAESELHGIVRATGETLGCIPLLLELGNGDQVPTPYGRRRRKRYNRQTWPVEGPPH